MRESQLHLKTQKEAPRGETSLNASLLVRAGFMEKLTAGVYNFLPLGLRVLTKIEGIVREEMQKLGAEEILMASLHPKKNWQVTKRWQQFDALFKVKSRFGQMYALGPTHEEVVTPLAQKLVSSYRDLPFALFQIQTKFRDEPRSRSGLLRGKEFIMKDLYSFHSQEKDLDIYYEKVKKSYQRIFKKCGLESIITEASGGTFARFSHEFQVISPQGEDTIYYCPHCGFARNKEVIGSLKKCPHCSRPLQKVKGIEVGNIFKLKDKYSRPFHLQFLGRDGKKHYVLMGCYGIGITRLAGVIPEIHHDKAGIIWPPAVAPYLFHLLSLTTGNKKEDKIINQQADFLYQKMQKEGREVLYDDRKNISNGKKLVEADLIGLPYRIVISGKTIKGKMMEIKQRKSKAKKIRKIKDFDKIFKLK